MEDLDYEKATDIPTDDELLMRDVVCGDAELFYLDACLREAFGSAMNREVVNV